MPDNPDDDQTMQLSDALDGMEHKTLIIGNLSRWKAQGRDIPPLEGFQFIELAELNADIVNEKQPDIILSPLVADDFDAVDVAVRLIELRFQGKYRVIADDMPDATLIRKEVRGFAPQLDFDLLLMSADDGKS